jgi:hypothetical protein
MRPHANRDGRAGLTILAVAAAGLLAACGPGQGSRSTTVVLTGPTDKVQALIAQHKLLAPPAKAQVEAPDGGRERVTVDLPKGLPMGEVLQLGKAAMGAGVNYEFSSGTKWSSGSTAGVQMKTTPPRSGGPVV